MCYLINIHLEDTGHNTPYKVKCFPRRTYGKTCLKISSSQDTGWEGGGSIQKFPPEDIRKIRTFIRQKYEGRVQFISAPPEDIQRNTPFHPAKIRGRGVSIHVPPWEDIPQIRL